jgi:hypothetical protein
MHGMPFEETHKTEISVVQTLTYVQLEVHLKQENHFFKND